MKYIAYLANRTKVHYLVAWRDNNSASMSQIQWGTFSSRYMTETDIDDPDNESDNQYFIYYKIVILNNLAINCNFACLIV